MTCTARFPNRPARRLALVIAAIMLTACTSSSSEDTAAGPATTATTTSTTTNPPTSEPATTTAPPSTTQATSEPAWTEEELAIIDAHDEFREAYYSVATSRTEPVSSLLPFTTVEYGRSLGAILTDLRTEGVEFIGSYRYQTTNVEVDGESGAVVRVCVDDQMIRVENGVAVSDEPENKVFLEAVMRRVDGVWLVAGANGIDVGLVGLECE